MDCPPELLSSLRRASQGPGVQGGFYKLPSPVGTSELGASEGKKSLVAAEAGADRGPAGRKRLSHGGAGAHSARSGLAAGSFSLVSRYARRPHLRSGREPQLTRSDESAQVTPADVRAERCVPAALRLGLRMADRRPSPHLRSAEIRRRFSAIPPWNWNLRRKFDIH